MKTMSVHFVSNTIRTIVNYLNYVVSYTFPCKCVPYFRCYKFFCCFLFDRNVRGSVVYESYWCKSSQEYF